MNEWNVETGPASQSISHEIRRAADDGAVATYFSLDRLLKAARPVEWSENLRAGIIGEFTEQGLPVPWGAIWHLAHVQIDGLPDGTWRVWMPEDLGLSGYVLAVVSDEARYEAARQNFLALATRPK